MNKIKLFSISATFLLLCVLIAGCSKNLPEVKLVGVTEITLKDELKDGLTLLKGTSVNIGWQVNVLPANATDLAENFSSSDAAVAMVNGLGQVTATELGTATITITVGGKSVGFPVTVVDKIIIPATKIQFAVPSVDVMVGTTQDLKSLIVLTPLEANDGLTFTSSNAGVATVNANGVVDGKSVGTTTITAASVKNPSISTSVTVNITKFYGDYSRVGWTMTASHALMIATGNPEKNSLSAALDGDITSNFCLVRPGKTSGNAPNSVTVPSGATIWFTVDMQNAREVSYFRILHRDVTQAFLRINQFDEILGSNDGTNFTRIAANVVVPNVTVASQQESVNIAIPKTTTRYLKFSMTTAACFNLGSFTSQGNTIQIQELNIGVAP